MVWSMWNAPSDRDYYNYGYEGYEPDEPEDLSCPGCGAYPDQACEEHCGRCGRPVTLEELEEQ